MSQVPPPAHDPYGPFDAEPGAQERHGDPYGAARGTGSGYGSNPYAPPADRAEDPYAAPSGREADPYEAAAAQGADPYAAQPWDAASAPGHAAPVGHGPQAAYAPQRPSSGIALASMIVGIASVTLSSVCGVGALAAPVGLVLSIMGMRDTAGDAKSGRGFAITGLVTSIVGCVLLVLGVLYLLFMFGILLWVPGTEY